MNKQRIFSITGLFGAIIVLSLSVPLHHQTENTSEPNWTPPRITDGQLDIQGMWNSADAVHTPLKLPDDSEHHKPTAENNNVRQFSR